MHCFYLSSAARSTRKSLKPDLSVLLQLCLPHEGVLSLVSSLHVFNRASFIKVGVMLSGKVELCPSSTKPSAFCPWISNTYFLYFFQLMAYNSQNC